MGRRRSYEVDGDNGGALTATETKDGKIEVTAAGDAAGEVTLTAAVFDEFLTGCRKEFFGGRTRQAVATAPEIADSSKGRKAAKE
jgi:hypothetical protein